MSDALATYLHDHLAGARHAVELLDAMRDEYSGQSLSVFSSTILLEIEADRKVLQDLAARTGAGPNSMKEVMTWFGEKLSRLKLRRGGEQGLGLMESLEFLGLGIQGKLALWRALSVLASDDPRLQGVDYQTLIERAASQYDAVEQRRLDVAATALREKH